MLERAISRSECISVSKQSGFVTITDKAKYDLMVEQWKDELEERWARKGLTPIKDIYSLYQRT